MIEDRVVGSLVGLAAGDCLGAPVEGRSRESICRSFGVLREFASPSPRWTDDTQQALVLAESTVRDGVPDPDWVARRFVEMSHPRGALFGCHRGAGGGFRAAVLAYEENGDWSAAGCSDRPGNGAAMRIAPVAAALTALPDEPWATAIVDVSRLTHRDLRGLAGALAVARVARQLVSEREYPLGLERGGAVLAELVAWLLGRERWLALRHPELDPGARERHDVSAALAGVLDHWDRGFSAWEPALVRFASARLGRRAAATEGFVLCSVVTAIGLVLGSNEDFAATVVRAVNLGGDTDTLGAMVGGMAGAGAGAAAIPARWRTYAGYPELLVWAEALGRRARAHLDGEEPAPATALPLPDLLVLERRLSGARSG